MVCKISCYYRGAELPQIEASNRMSRPGSLNRANSLNSFQTTQTPDPDKLYKDYPVTKQT